MPGLVRPIDVALSPRRPRIERLGETKVEKLRVTASGHEDVRRFDVAMNDVAAVRRVQRIGDLDRELERLVAGKRLAVDAFLQRLPFEPLHHDEGPALVLADFVNDADVRMIQRRRGPRLADKPLERGLVGRHLGRQELQRHRPAERRVLGLIDDAHSAAAQTLTYPISRNGLSNHSVQSLGNK